MAADFVARMARDQEARSAITDPPIDDAAWEQVAAVDAENTAWFKSVLDQRGWPRRSEVGAEAALAAWLFAQHADLDKEFQRRCLTLLEAVVRDGEADPGHLAYLTDRVLRGEGRPQLYGTQFWRRSDGDGEWAPQPIEDPEGLDERRRRVGLEPFSEYECRMRSRRRSETE